MPMQYEHFVSTDSGVWKIIGSLLLERWHLHAGVTDDNMLLEIMRVELSLNFHISTRAKNKHKDLSYISL